MMPPVARSVVSGTVLRLSNALSALPGCQDRVDVLITPCERRRSASDVFPVFAWQINTVCLGIHWNSVLRDAAVSCLTSL